MNCEFVNGTYTNASLGCVMYDAGSGLGSFFGAIGSPIGILILIIVIAVGMVGLFKIISAKVGGGF